ncbi:MAG: flagellar hook-basal body complex protein FliE [Acidobacteriota bacterium]|nr:flagellar hook-basal body complex protein FliE [Acidobacteriota bacterium]
MNITPASLAVAAPASVSPSPPSGSTGTSFANLLGSAISSVESAQADASQLASNLLVGGQGDLHTVALASQKAELSLELFQQVRNKFVQAYQEVMKMPM